MDHLPVDHPQPPLQGQSLHSLLMTYSSSLLLIPSILLASFSFLFFINPGQDGKTRFTGDLELTLLPSLFFLFAPRRSPPSSPPSPPSRKEATNPSLPFQVSTFPPEEFGWVLQGEERTRLITRRPTRTENPVRFRFPLPFSFTSPPKWPTNLNFARSFQSSKCQEEIKTSTAPRQVPFNSSSRLLLPLELSSRLVRLGREGIRLSKFG